MINITDKSNCCGCHACVQVCPKQCISMHKDKEGFLYPQINISICIDCGQCDRICPVINQQEEHSPKRILAIRNTDEEKLLRSSSGGVFVALAEQTIDQGGIVFGARFNCKWEVVHGYTEKLEELDVFMRSKYVQSIIGNAYKDAERFLRQGRQVMFVATPCQIAGLKKYLRKDYDNLLAVDFICHGVPSPGVWRRFLKEQTTKSITDINFRTKQGEGRSWTKYALTINGQAMPPFLRTQYIRPSCYTCPAKTGKSGADITLGDCWGIDKLLPNYKNDDKGTSIVIPHNTIALNKLNNCPQLEIIGEIGYKDLLRYNPSYAISVTQPKERTKFWKAYHRGLPVIQCIDKSYKLSIWEKMINKLR